MAINLERRIKIHKRRKIKSVYRGALIGAVSLVALFTVSWCLKIIGFSLTNNKPYRLSNTVVQLNGTNNDTAISGDNLYRQYLSVTGIQDYDAVDLLLLIDQSGSMSANSDFRSNDDSEDEIYRDVVLSTILNGSANADYRAEMNEDEDGKEYSIESQVTEAGFVNRFLQINPDNKIAIIGFDAWGDEVPEVLNTNEALNITDTRVLLDWTNIRLEGEGIDVTAHASDDTNYDAGLRLADEMFNVSSIKDDGNTKLLIIISDGVPTCWIDENGNSVGVSSEVTVAMPEILEVPVITEEEEVEPSIAEPVPETIIVTEEPEEVLAEEVPSESVEAPVEEPSEIEVTEEESSNIETEPSIEETVIEEITEEPSDITESEANEEEEAVVLEEEPEVISEEVSEESPLEEPEATEAAPDTEVSEVIPEEPSEVIEEVESSIPEVVPTEEEIVPEEEPEVVVPAAPAAPVIEESPISLSDCREPSISSFEKLISNNEDLIVYSIGLSDELKSQNPDDEYSDAVISQLTNGDGEYIFVENNMEDLENILFEITQKNIPNNVVLTSELSKYVEFLPAGYTDAKVTMTTSDGRLVVLYDEANGGVTGDGYGIVDSVVCEYAEDIELSNSTGSVKCIFDSSYVLNKECTYTLSYNISLTADALECYINDGYPNKGDADTDYDLENLISSNADGFFVNKVAYVTYEINGAAVSYDPSNNSDNIFARPVVQFGEAGLALAIENMDDSAMGPSSLYMPMALAAYSDGNGDNVNFNKSIENIDGDLYRLYLNIEGLSETQTKGVDLLIVVDQSGSMFDNKDVSYDGENGLYRDVVISRILNGSANLRNGTRSKPQNGRKQLFIDNYESTYKLVSKVTNDSLINQFLDLNSANKVAVIGFDAWRNTADDGKNNYQATNSRDGYNSSFDARILYNWSSNKLAVDSEGLDVTGQYSTGTNYDASFRLAYDMFAQVKGDNNDKMMIFISDGVPTCYVIDNQDGTQDRAGTTISYINGDLNNPDTDNIRNCRQPSLNAFNNLVYGLRPLGIYLDAYSIGISSELVSTDYNNVVSDWVIRQCIASNGEPGVGANHYVFAQNGDQLDQQLHHIINRKFPSEVVITDKLSQYVKYYDNNPNVTVVKTNKITGEEVVLYNGSVTSAGNGIIKSVDFVPAYGKDDTTGTITATFDPDYALEDNCTYTLAYNVKLTDVAYSDYINNGNKYPNVGDLGTDHNMNKPPESSNQEGFYSNKEADVDYFLECEETVKGYDHPVVQIDPEEIFTNVTVKKIWEDDNGQINPVEPVWVQLYQIGNPASMSIYEDFNDLDYDKFCVFKGIDESNVQLVDVDGSGNKAVWITGRKSDWRGFDLVLSELGGKEVTLETNVKATSGTVNVILFYDDGSEHYPSQLEINGCADEYRSGSVTITVPNGVTKCTAYLSTSGANDDLYIDYFNAVVPMTANLPAYVPPQDDVNNTTTLNENFGNTNNYSDRSNNSATITLVDADYPGNKALMITDRGDNWHGISLPANNFIGKSINLEVRGKATSGQVQFGVQYDLDGSTEYKNATDPIAGSTNVYAIGSQIFSIPADATNCSVFIQGSNGDADLYIDYVYVSVVYVPNHMDMNVNTALYENFGNTSNYSDRSNNTATITVIDGEETGNRVLRITNRGDGWHGISLPADNFIGKTITVTVRGMATSGNIVVGSQYNQNGETQYTNEFNVQNQDGSYGVASSTMTIPRGASNCTIYVQGSNTTGNLYIDYVYIVVQGQAPNEPIPTPKPTSTPMVATDNLPSEVKGTEGPYRQRVQLTFADNLNEYVFTDLPKWGLDENGNKLLYSYYVVEDTTGKNYKSTTYSVDATNPVTEGTITITNTIEGVFGYELPNTGGIGTGFNYLTGFILIGITGGYYIKRIRKRSVRDP
ncbi:MAG: carbohydrate binding domain-containing protein [Clostridia bacterium]|nr:carbohydrate binding domain-containing protein [Clostridia bacterium]